MLAMNRVTFVGIDQVRANIKIDGPFAAHEQTVGVFKNFKAATSIAALNHYIAQWLFFSKKATITAADNYTGVNGWLIDVYTEKNKYAPSQYAITCVFDKLTGINKFWSEYHFLSNFTPSEDKLFKKGVKEFWPLLLQTSGAYTYLYIPHPKTGEIVYESDKFYKKNALEYYNTNEDFRKSFDKAVDISVYMRLKVGLFNIVPQKIDKAESTQESTEKAQEK